MRREHLRKRGRVTRASVSVRVFQGVNVRYTKATVSGEEDGSKVEGKGEGKAGGGAEGAGPCNGGGIVDVEVEEVFGGEEGGPGVNGGHDGRKLACVD